MMEAHALNIQETTVTERITLPLDATVSIADRTGTAVEQNSVADALRIIGQRHRRGPAMIELHPTHLEDERFNGKLWSLADETPVPAEDAHAADYTLQYTAYLITDTSGVTRNVQLGQIDGIAQRMADETQSTVRIDSVLLGLDSWKVHPSPVAEFVEPEPEPTTEDDQPDTKPETPEKDVPMHQNPPTAAETPSEESSERPMPESFAETFATRRTSRKDMLAPAEEGWRGSFNRGLGMKLKPGSHERELRELRARIQQGLDGSKTVMFANIKGGANKTTTSFAIGAAVGRVRGGNVLSWDNNENKGNLVSRGQRAPHGRTAIELYSELESLTTLSKVDQLTHYMHPQGDNRFDVLASQDVAATKQVIDADAFRSMHSILRTFYSMILVDTGNATNATTWQATADAADVIVLTMQNTEDSANGAALTLDAIREHAGEAKVANAVAVITQTAKPSQERTTRIHEILGPQIRAVLEVPFDESLKEGEEIVWESLHRSTREAYLHVAAAIVDGISR